MAHVKYAKGGLQRPGDGSPRWSQGQSPGRGSEDEVPEKLKL